MSRTLGRIEGSRAFLWRLACAADGLAVWQRVAWWRRDLVARMGLGQYLWAALAATLAFSSVLCLATFVDQSEAKRHDREREAAVHAKLDRLSSDIALDLDVALGELRSLAFWADSDFPTVESRFDEYSQDLLRRHGSLRWVGLLPGDVVARTYPSLPSFIGLDAARDPVRAAAVSSMKASRDALVSGPIALPGGVSGFVLRVPAFRMVDGTPGRYWGHVALVFDAARLEKLLKERGRTAALDVRLVDADGRGPTANLQLGSRYMDTRHARSLVFSVPGEQWKLTGVSAHSGSTLGESTVAAAVASLLALLVGAGAWLLAVATQRLKAQYLTLERLATTDPLTGAYNRRFVLNQIGQELQRRRRGGVPFSVVLLDLDHFKAVNDTYGHGTGDMALKMTARLVADTVRASDLVARWGGEEFLVFAPETTQAGALELAERLRARIEDCRIPTARTALHVTASFGVAQSELQDTSDSLIDRADQALYEAKAGGRNRCTVSERPAMSSWRMRSDVLLPTISRHHRSSKTG